MSNECMSAGSEQLLERCRAEEASYDEGNLCDGLYRLAKFTCASSAASRLHDEEYTSSGRGVGWYVLLLLPLFFIAIVMIAIREK